MNSERDYDDDGTSTLDLPVDLPLIAARAAAGDESAWGELYGITGAIVRGGKHPVPEPLSSLIGERLECLATALMSPGKDVAKGLYAAVAPATKRKPGPKRHKHRAVEVVAECVADLIEGPAEALNREKRPPGYEEGLIVASAQSIFRSEETMEKAVKKERASRKKQKGNGSPA